MSEDGLIYLISDYAATGEGRTISIMITAAWPVHEDYEIQPSYNENGLDPGTLKNTAEERAVREFNEKFGEWFATGVEILDRYEFFHRYGNHVPEYIYKMTDTENGTAPYMHYSAQVHYNYS